MIHDCDATLRRKLEKTYLITGIASRVAATTLSAAPMPNRKRRREISGGVVRVDPGSFVAMTSPLFIRVTVLPNQNPKFEARNPKQTKHSNQKSKSETWNPIPDTPSPLSSLPRDGGDVRGGSFDFLVAARPLCVLCGKFFSWLFCLHLRDANFFTPCAPISFVHPPSFPLLPWASSSVWRCDGSHATTSEISCGLMGCPEIFARQ